MKKSSSFKAMGFFFFIIFQTYYGCKETTKSTYFEALNTKPGFLNMKPTKFCLKSDRIYEIDVYLNAPEAFVWNNYLVLIKDKLYEISLYENCKEKYFTDDFKIYMDFSNEEYRPCNIYLDPILDFSLNEKDTLRIGERSWVVLKQVFFDKITSDRIYKFERSTGRPNTSTIIFADKNRGIIGAYQLNNWGGNIDTSHVIGTTFLKKEAHINKHDLRFPKVNLNNIKFFTLCKCRD